MRVKTMSVMAAATVLATAAGQGPAAASTSEETEEHCLLEVIGQEPDGEYITAEPVCYPTLGEVLDDLGIDVDALDDTGAAGRAARAMAASSALGTHFADAGRTGSSITISGADCGGGYVNLSAGWVDRISSTRNYCPTVVFWTGFDKSGSNEITSTSSINLGPLNNLSRSIGYGS